MILSFWRKELYLPNLVFNKPTDRTKYYTKPVVNKYPNGILRIQINSVELLNHIYGAINCYSGFNVFSYEY